MVVIWPIVNRRDRPVEGVAIAGDPFSRAALDALLAKRYLLGRLRLAHGIRLSGFVVAGEYHRCDLAAQVAVSALVVDVILTGDVERVSPKNVRFHGLGGVTLRLSSLSVRRCDLKRLTTQAQRLRSAAR